MNKTPLKHRGFTLVELTVSLAIAGILMLGLSAFFAGSFGTLFNAQQDAEREQKKFVISEIIRQKFRNIDSIVAGGGGGDDYVVVANKPDGKTLPFTYIGLNGDGKLVFKDFMIFNKIYNYVAMPPVSHLFADGGTGFIKSYAGEVNKDIGTKNIGGFVRKDDSTYYVTLPLEGKILECDPGCSDFVTGFKMPMDLEINDNKTLLYASDAGNGTVVAVNIANATKNTISSNFDFPIGLVFYKKDDDRYLFVADAVRNQIIRVKTDGSDYTVIAGLGSDNPCDGTALNCQLNFPTGVYADGANHALYVADTGNNRVLKISDPGAVTSVPITYNLANSYALEKIELTNLSGGNLGATNLLGTYDSGTTTFNAASPTYVVSEGLCVSTGNRLYFDNNAYPFAIQANQKVMVAGNVYTVQSRSTKDCDADPDVVNTKDELVLTSNLSANPPVPTPIYFATPDTVNLPLNGVTLSPGFQTIEIKTYEQGNTLVDTSYFTVAVGDAVLGTSEDKVEVLKTGLNYPTGVSDAYVANSLNEPNPTIEKLNPPSGNVTLNSFDSSFSAYDYTSDFDVTSLTFSQPNGGKLLQAQITAADGQSYTLTTSLD